MAATPNQFLLYDTSVTQWVVDSFTGCAPQGTTLSILTGTPDRAFAEFVTITSSTPRDGRPPLPRVAITIEDPVLDQTRFNPHKIRMLGYTDSNQYKIRKAKYPVPVRLAYTLNFWTEKYREMNLFEQQLLTLFAPNYLNIKVDIDSISPVPVYGSKDIEMYADGEIANTGDLEPGEGGERIYRRTFNMYLNAWIWDLNFTESTTVREIELGFYEDRDLTQLLEVVSTPQKEVLVSAVNGVDTSFGPVQPTRSPIVEGTLLVDAVIGGSPVRARDDGSGNIVDNISSQVTGTVDYGTTDITLTYTTAPDSGTDITVGFFTKDVC